MSRLVSKALRWMFSTPVVHRAGHPTLATMSEPVVIEDIHSRRVIDAIKQMRKTMESNIYSMSSISAPQLGINSRIIGFRTDVSGTENALFINPATLEGLKDTPLTFIINPEFKPMDNRQIEEYLSETKRASPITEIKRKEAPVTEKESLKRHGNIIYDYEACECIPKFNGIVHRYNYISVAGYDPEGKKLALKCHGLLSRLIQHEIDHLNGILYTDKMEPKTFRHEKYIREHQANLRVLESKRVY